MILGALDIATTTGLAWEKDGVVTASSFRPREKRPGDLDRNEIDFEYEGRLGCEFREHLRPWLVGNEIEVVGIEQPLNSNLKMKKKIINTDAEWAGESIQYEDVGATTMATIFRIYGLVQQALSLCAALNIDVHMISQHQWRSAFIGVTKAPAGTTNNTAWLKARARQQCEWEKIEVRNDDQADAVGVLWALRARLNPRLAAHANDLFRQVSA